MRFKWNWRDLAIKVLLVWWRITRPRTVGVRGIVQNEHGHILFVRHNYASRRWYLPGGGANGSETADESMVREMWEETRLRVEITRLVGVYLWLASFKRDNIFVFECKWLDGDLRVDGGEISEAGWFPLEDLPEPLTPGTRKVLDDWQSGRTGYGHWPGEVDQ